MNKVNERRIIKDYVLRVAARFYKKHKKQLIYILPFLPSLVNKYFPKQQHSNSQQQYSYSIETINRSLIRGWVLDNTNKRRIFDIDIYINNNIFYTIKNNTRRPTRAGGFQLFFPPGLFCGTSNYAIRIKLPNGKQIRVGTIGDTKTRTFVSKHVITKQNKISIIIPVYNAADDFRLCLECLFEHTTVPSQLIIINDASTDPQISHILKSASQRESVVILTNETNLGFTRTINRGIEYSKNDDVVLLNSDARVTPKWLEGLCRAASSNSSIGTVTPLSDRAGAFSAPKIGNENELPFGVAEAHYAIALRRWSYGAYPTVPTGNGFCLYIRRAVLDEIGFLDEVAFPRGYGEENDFCMRAERAGWSHVIDDRTYVFHSRGKSFGEEKNILLSAGRKILNERYPEYSKRIQVFSSDKQLCAARELARRASIESQSFKGTNPSILFVISTETGGTPQTNRDLMKALEGTWDTWLLHCREQSVTLFHVTGNGQVKVAEHTLQDPVDPITLASTEYDNILQHWLTVYDFSVVHIRHLAWHSLSLPRIARSSGAAVVMSFHDYYCLCPTVNLLDGDGEFCAGICTDSASECPHALWPENSFPPLKHAWIKQWRKKHAQSLAEWCDMLVTTSSFTRKTILDHLPSMPPDRFHVIPHGRDFASFVQLGHCPGPKEKLRILVPGNISKSKGRDIICALLEEDKDEWLEFHILGSHNFDFSHPRLIFHGKYSRENFAQHAESITPHIGAVFSIWDETWCHTLTELWSVGLPVMVFDFPTVGTRVKECGGGWVYSHQNITALYTSIVTDGFDPVQHSEKCRAVQQWQSGIGLAGTSRLMASRYHIVYSLAMKRRFLESQTFKPFTDIKYSSDDKNEKTIKTNNCKNIVAVVCTPDKRLSRAYATTHIRIWERTINTPKRKYVFCRMQPAELIASVKAGEINIAILQRTFFPSNLWAELKPLVEAGHLRYLFDIDDDLLNVPPDKDPKQNYENYKTTLSDLMQHASLVTVSTTALQNRLISFNANTVVLENALSLRIWRGNIPNRVNDGVFRAFYMGSFTHDADLRMIMPALQTVADQHPEFRLRLVGIMKEAPKDIPNWMELVEAPEDKTEYPAFAAWLKRQTSDIDIGIAPLEDNQFNQYKSALKILDYAALGLPVLASAGDVYNDMGGQAPHVTLVENNIDRWEAAIQSILANQDSLVEQRVAMRNWVFKNHMLESKQIKLFDNLITTKVC